MATIIVSFENEREAQEAVRRLSQANLGEIRTRVLDSSENMSYQKNESTSPTISPELGSVEVRPAETPSVPEAMHEESQDEISASIPTTGSSDHGVQVMIEVDDQYEQTVRDMLKQ